MLAAGVSTVGGARDTGAQPVQPIRQKAASVSTSHQPHLPTTAWQPGEFRLYVASVVSPVTPNKNGSAVGLGESKTNDAAILHDPVEIVTSTVTWWPERAETAFTVYIPLSM